MGAWIIVGLTLAAYAYAMYKQSKIAVPPQQAFVGPTADEGVAIPVVFGSAIIRNTNVSCLYDREFSANSVGTLDDSGALIVNESINTGAPLYSATIQLGLCHGKIDDLLDVYTDNKSCLSSKKVNSDNSWWLQLYAGRDSKHSTNWGGWCRITNGIANNSGVDAGVSDYLAQVQGMPGGIGSRYYGVATALLQRFLWGTSPLIRPMSFAVKRIHTRHGGTAAQWYDAKAEIPSGVRSREDVWSWKMVPKSDTTLYTGILFETWDEGRGGFGNATAGYAISKDVENYTTVPTVNTQLLTADGLTIGGHPNYSVPEGMKLWLRTDMGPLPAFGLVVQCWHDDSARLWCNGHEITLTPSNIDLVKEHFTSTAVIPAEYLNEGSGSNIIAYCVQDSYAADGTTKIGTNKLIYAGIQVGADVGTEPPPGMGSMNGAHIILEALTDKVWGMGRDDSDVDLASFAAAADTLYLERLGLAFEWSQQMSVEDLIDDVKRHISAALYVAPDTGLFTLKLIRDDYVITDLPVLDESHIVEIEEASRKQPGELINCVTVTYTASLRGDKGATAPLFDDDLVEIQGGIVSTQIDYPAITTHVNAAKLAERDLRILSSSLLTCRLRADRTAASFHPGKPFVLNWPSLGFDNLVMRVDEMDSGDGIDNSVKITCIEDVFFFPSQSTVVPSDPIGLAPVAAPTATVALDGFRTALTVDTRNKGSVVFVMFVQELDTYSWTSPTPGTLEWDPGSTPAWGIAGLPFDGQDVDVYGKPSWAIGKSILLFGNFPGSSIPLSSFAKRMQGVWVIDNLGGHWEGVSWVYDKVQFHRDPSFAQSSDFTTGMVLNVRNGTNYGGHYLQLNSANVVLETTEQDWTDEGTSFTFTDTYDLLKNDQFAGRSVSPDSAQEMSVTMAAGTAGLSHGFETLVGTPKAKIIPAGKWTVMPSEISISGGDVDAFNTVGFRFIKDKGTSSEEMLELLSARLSAGLQHVPVITSATAAFSFSETDRVVLLIQLHTDSVAPVTMAVKYNAANAIRVSIPRDTSHDNDLGGIIVNTPIHIGVNEMSLDHGINHATVVSSTDRRPCLPLAQGALSTVGFYLKIPNDTTTADFIVRPIFTVPADVSGSVMWSLFLSLQIDNDVSIPGVDQPWLGSGGSKVAGSSVLEMGTSIGSFTSGKRLHVQLSRVVAGDTLASVINLLGIQIDYQAKVAG